MLSRRRIVAVAVAAALMLVALVGVAAAQTGGTVPGETGKALVESADDAALDDLREDGDYDECFFDEDWEPTAEEIAEINAETDALVEYLQGLGFEVTVETDEFGITYVDFESEDEAMFEAMDEFYRQQFADEVAGWSDAEKAEWNAGIDEFVAEMAELGITVEIEEIAAGVYDIVWTEELEEALFDLEEPPFGDFEIEGEFESDVDGDVEVEPEELEGV